MLVVGGSNGETPLSPSTQTVERQHVCTIRDENVLVPQVSISSVKIMASEIIDFYAGKHVFITGGTGFMGKVSQIYKPTAYRPCCGPSAIVRSPPVCECQFVRICWFS